MDDLDDLLDEVEKDLMVNETPKKCPNHSNLPRDTKRSAIDDDIDSILTDGDFRHELPTKTVSNKAEKLPMNSAKAKCFPLYLSGVSLAQGQSSSREKRACNKLRCTACDFHIVSFDNFKWASSAEYLFFRNNMPDRPKLMKKLLKSPGSRSYCCQCSWKSVSEPISVSQFKNLKWVCGKH